MEIKMAEVRVIKLNESVYSKNDNQADMTRRMFNDKKVFFVNIMSSPGSGKTTLSNAIVEHLSKVRNDKTQSFLNNARHLISHRTWLQTAKAANDSQNIVSHQDSVEYYKTRIEEMYGKVELSFHDIYSISKDFLSQNYIIDY